MRGIKTLAMRMERQCANACKVAAWLSVASARRARVLSPATPRIPTPRPSRACCRRITPARWSSFELKDAGRERSLRFMEKLKMIVRATSLGDVHTMVLYPAMASHRDLSPKHRERLGIGDNLVRISVGIEASGRHHRRFGAGRSPSPDNRCHAQLVSMSGRYTNISCSPLVITATITMDIPCRGGLTVIPNRK